MTELRVPLSSLPLAFENSTGEVIGSNPDNARISRPSSSRARGLLQRLNPSPQFDRLTATPKLPGGGLEDRYASHGAGDRIEETLTLKVTTSLLSIIRTILLATANK
ncbi:MAG: hypothetical protein JW915_05505 [Chitinispirillaceae bacterium]|nr:hypothetical protein [Chitinispirillaceae bacterium]